MTACSEPSVFIDQYAPGMYDIDFRRYAASTFDYKIGAESRVASAFHLCRSFDV